jgi:MerR family regulatory protein
VDLMSIGEFARLSRLSAKALRLYDELGLLPPAQVDSARRDLAGYLVDRLTGKRNVMHEVKVRDIPARSLLCLLRQASNEQEVWAMGKEVIGMLKAQPVPVPRTHPAHRAGAPGGLRSRGRGRDGGAVASRRGLGHGLGGRAAAAVQ